MSDDATPPRNVMSIAERKRPAFWIANGHRHVANGSPEWMVLSSFAYANKLQRWEDQMRNRMRDLMRGPDA